MPIKGLSDRDSVDPRFKEIGRLRKGGEKKGNRPGEDLEYFRFVPNNNRQDVSDAFREAYGEAPTHLEVYFPFDRMERVFSSYREAYGQNRLCKLRCDGENWIDWIEGDRHHHSAQGRPCDLDCKDVENKCPKCPCGYYGRLSVILPELWFAGKIGLVTVLTTSINDIAALSAKLVQWEPLTKKPFTLWRAPERIGVPIQGKRAAVEKSLLHLELKEEQLIAAFLEAQEQERPMLTQGAEWPEPADDAYEDWQEIQEDEHVAQAAQRIGKDPAELHWLRDETTRKRFWKYAGQDLALSNEQVHEALGVSSAYDFQGTKADALKALKAYASRAARLSILNGPRKRQLTPEGHQ